MLHLSFETDHPAFKQDRGEVTALIRLVADYIDSGATEGPLHYTNGRQIGTWRLTDDDWRPT